MGMCEQEARTFSMTEAGVLLLNWTTCSCLPKARSNEEQPVARISAEAAAITAAIGRTSTTASIECRVEGACRYG